MDVHNFIEQMNHIVQALGAETVSWDYEEHLYVEDECNKPNLEKALSSLNCGSNDVIFFYYSGHGVHAKADAADGWFPQMCLTYHGNQQNMFVPVKHVRDALAKKGARLTIIMSDCCNRDESWVSVKSPMSAKGKQLAMKDFDRNAIKKLFCESKGTVIATSSKRGQVSYATSKLGGYFTLSVLASISDVIEGFGTPTWNYVLSEAKKTTLLLTSNRQEPDYKIGTDLVQNPIPPISEYTSSVIAIGESELASAISPLINRKTYGVLERNAMIPNIVSNHFAPDAKVQVLGPNRSTRIGARRDVADYLKELAFSKTIVSVNITVKEKSASGKCKYIEVTELREY